MSFAGRGVGFVSGVLMIVFETYWFIRWWGMTAGLISLFIPPLAVLFPFVYWFKEGFSLLYFILWVLAWVGMFLGGRGEE